MDRIQRARDLIRRYSDLRVGASSPRWNELQAEIDRFVKAQDHEQLVALGDLLVSEPDDPFHLAKLQARNGLALMRSVEAIDAFLARSDREVSSRPGMPRDRRAREHAALLGHAQDAMQLDRALRDHGEDPALCDLLACWVQECLLRGGDVGALPSARALWSRLDARDYPLAWLPLELSEIERGMLVLPQRVDWLGNWFSFGRSMYPAPDTQERAAPLSATPQIPVDAATQARISCFIGDPLLYPNASFEVASFYIGMERPVSVIKALQLECLGEASEVRFTELHPRDALSLLFGMATQGGAYGRGYSGAWGRLHAWHCGAALAGLDGEPAYQDAVSAVEQARWAFFDSDSAWWNHVCIDFGIACKASGSSVLRVLAATDTD